MKLLVILLSIFILTFAASAQGLIDVAVIGSAETTGDTTAAQEAAALEAMLMAMGEAGLAVGAADELEDLSKRKKWIEGWAERVIAPGYHTLKMGWGADGKYYAALFGKVNPKIFSQENIQGNNKFGTALRLIINDKARALDLMLEVVNQYQECESADDALYNLIVKGEFAGKAERLSLIKDKFPQSPLLPKAEKHFEEYGKIYTFDGLEFTKIPPGSLAVEARKKHIGSFYIQTTELTQSQWKAVMEDNPSVDKGEDKPVVNVSLRDALNFVEKLNQRAGNEVYRIPDIYQWEYACRSGSNGKYCYGSDPETLRDYAWFTANTEGAVQPVAMKKPNYWGLYDVHGNAWEWCLHPEKKPKKRGMIKGGSRASSPELLECSGGKEKSAKAQFIDAGFRIVRIVE